MVRLIFEYNVSVSYRIAASFLLLEQILPAGPDHPFAKTMLDHFAKRTPLKSVLQYPTIHHQENRFLRAGYLNAIGESLWDFWEGSIIDMQQKVSIDKVEPFDEWEEFILFASHYIVLHAYGTDPFNNEPSASPKKPNLSTLYDKPNHHPLFVVVQHGIIQKRSIGQRMVSSMAFKELNSEKVTVFVPTGMQSPANREWIAYSTEAPHQWPASIPLAGLSCYTVTRTGDDIVLLVGGRVSPSKVNSQCFLYRWSSNTWTKVHSLEVGRYRHCALSVKAGDDDGVLIFGGRTADCKILSDWLLWTERAGWTTLPCALSSQIDSAPALFGTAMTDGLILGGIDDLYIISRKIWRWSLKAVHLRDNGHRTQSSFSIVLHSAENIKEQRLAARFGACVVNLPSKGPIIIGGVAPAPLKLHEEALRITEEKTIEQVQILDNTLPRPLLIGVVASLIDTDSCRILITGGGGVCFSFGSCFNAHWYFIQDSKNKTLNPWVCFTTGDKSSLPLRNGSSLEIPSSDCRTNMAPNKSTNTVVIERSLAKLHEQIEKSLEPVITRGTQFGSCQRLWDLKYLDLKIGSLHIAIHEGQSRHLIFTPQKNFQYRTCTFSEFKGLLEQKKHVYLRALAGNHSFKGPANFWKDFPTIADDLLIPQTLKDGFNLDDKLHSAVLRVSGDVSVWIHYDVMSNFYFQIRGSKTFILFPPTEALKLKFTPGNTSSPMDSRSDFSNIAHKTVQVKAGDILFIPRFWAHATFNEGEDIQTSIAVNVFWQDLDMTSYAVGKDVYGNRDLAGYEHGREVIQSIANRLRSHGSEISASHAEKVAQFLVEGTQLENPQAKEARSIRTRLLKMPKDVGDFYLPRLADELVQLVGI
jgi:tRNA wybutosine-synthesizing protein 4